MGKKVFSVYMGDPDSSSHSELDLPATPWELIDALDKLRLEDGRESYWQVEDIGRYGFLAPLLDDSDLYQFNALAEQLSTFDHVEAIAFEGLVQMEVDKLCQTNGGELTLQRLLDLAYSVDGCHVVPEVRDDAALGRFYVENDFLSELEQVPDSVLELLDYAKIGEKMRRDEHGAMTPNGYVVREAELRQAPPNLGRPPRKPPYMIHFLCVSDVRAVKLYLPAKQAELDAVLDCLEVDSWQEVQLEECDTAMPEMWAFVDMAHTSMEQVNQFAQCLEMLDANGELAAFKAVASQLDIYKLEDAMALTEHLSEYAFEPNIHSLEDRAREELSLMADGPELDLLIRNLNLTAYGADLMYRDRGMRHDTNREECPLMPISETSLCESFCRLYYKLKHQSIPILEQMLTNLQMIRNRRMLWSPDIVALNKKISDLSSQNQTLAFLKQQGLVDPDIFISKTNELTKQLRQAKLEKEKLMDAESDMTALQTRDLIDLLEGGPEFLDSFDAELFGELVEKIIIESNDSVRFCLKNGLELRESIERTVR